MPKNCNLDKHPVRHNEQARNALTTCSYQDKVCLALPGDASTKSKWMACFLNFQGHPVDLPPLVKGSGNHQLGINGKRIARRG